MIFKGILMVDLFRMTESFAWWTSYPPLQWPAKNYSMSRSHIRYRHRWYHI